MLNYSLINSNPIQLAFSFFLFPKTTLLQLGVYKYFGFINGVDNVNWPPYTEILKADVSSVSPSLEKSAFRISVRWPIYIINSVDKTKTFNI